MLADGPAVVAVTETWLTDNTPSNLLTDCHNYTVHRKDRLDRRGGGVCILVNNDIFQSSLVQIPIKYNCIEIVAVDIMMNGFTCRFVNVYRSPSSDTDIDGVQYCIKLAECLEFLNIKQNLTMVTCGDFNIDNLFAISDNSFGCSQIISSFFINHAFTQYVSSPTRYCSSGNTASLLDLVLCNDDHFIMREP